MFKSNNSQLSELLNMVWGRRLEVNKLFKRPPKAEHTLETNAFLDSFSDLRSVFTARDS